MATNAQYDAHGNTTFIGSGSHPLQLLYDSSDRNRGIEKYTSPGVGTASYYNRDVQNRIIQREATTITNWNWATDSLQKHGFIGSGSSPSFIKNGSSQVVEKYLSLPGRVMVTIRPNESQDANKKMYSLSNMHGDVMATTNASGALLGTYAYDPFGNKTSTTLPTNTATGTTFAWVGLHQKITETSMTLTPIQMGARLYFPTLGRFAQVDPIPGGNPNDYIYPPDPINMMDVSGMYSIPLFNSCHPICNVASIVAPIAKATGVSAAPYRPTASAKPSPKPASKPAAAAAGPPKNTSHSIGAGVVKPATSNIGQKILHGAIGVGLGSAAAAGAAACVLAEPCGAAVLLLGGSGLIAAGTGAHMAVSSAENRERGWGHWAGRSLFSVSGGAICGTILLMSCGSAAISIGVTMWQAKRN